jgi:Protein of unknown function (DUF3617)
MKAMIEQELIWVRRARGRCQVLGALVLFGASWSAVAAASLDAKPGLWERTVVMLSELAPTGPKPDLSKLAPEQRKKLEQVMSGSATTSRRTRVTQECVTPAMLQKWSTVMGDASGAKCERKVEVENPKRFKVALSCDGGKTTGDIDFTASGEGFKGSVTLKSREAEFDRIVTQQISSKWLGSDCGSVVPAQP